MNKKPNLFKKSIYCFPKEYFLIVLLVLLSIQNVFAEDDIQQLESKLLNLPEDTVKVNTLIKLGEYYCSVDNEKALMYLQEAFTISTSQKYKEGIGKSLLWQGRVYYYKDDYFLSIKYLDKAKEILETTNELDALAFLYFAKAATFNIRGDHIHALEMYKESIKLTELTGNAKLMSSCYRSIGVVLLNRKDPEKALVYFRETLSIKKAIDDQKGISNTLTCIGKSYEELGELDSSLIYYNQALLIRSNLKMDRAIAGSEYNIGGILIKMGKYVQAEESLQIALDNFIKLNEKTGICITNLRLAVARNYQGKPDAFNLAESALSMARKMDNPSLISLGYKILSDISFYNANYKKSYEFLLKHKILQDSLFTAGKERLLTEFEAKFQSERKDSEISLLKGKSKIQRKNNILLTILIIVLAGVIVLLFFLFRFKSTAFYRQQKLLEQDNIIHTQENEIIEKENLILQKQLESKNRELASKALEMIRFNDTISIVIERLEGFNSAININPEESKHIKNIIYELENQTKQNIWNEFDKIFKNIHLGFYDKLLEICPDLTATEIKTAALLKLNLTTKEIAAIAFKSEGGIKTTRYRLRKKLSLSSDEKLVPFLMKI
ncbi:MAG: hypothetical protein KAT48_03315 [Bacteroidales bacterium]|nr:hypothetical protein [Bacteroidales bacterium]